MFVLQIFGLTLLVGIYALSFIVLWYGCAPEKSFLEFLGEAKVLPFHPLFSWSAFDLEPFHLRCA